MFVTSDFACFDLQSTSDFSLIRRSISEKSKQAQMILPQGLSTIFSVFSLSGLAFPAGSTVLQNDLVSVMVRCDRKTQNPVLATGCGFDPRHRHHPESLFLQGFREFFMPFLRSNSVALACVHPLNPWPYCNTMFQIVTQIFNKPRFHILKSISIKIIIII